MKLLYISSVNPLVKSGYFNAVADRLNQLRLDTNLELTAINYSRHADTELFDTTIHKPKFMVQKGPLRYLENFYIFRKLMRILSTTKPDIVHVHWCYPIGYCTIKACKALNIPCVLTSHGSDIHSNPLKNSYIYLKSAWALKNSSSNIFVSESLQTQAQELFGAISASLVIPNALDVAAIYSNLPPKEKRTTKQILYMGNLNTTKGADLLPSIFAEIINRSSKNEIHFLIAGHGPLYSQINSQLLELKINVKLLGHVPRSDALKLINSSDLVIIPSRHEGFGIVALEAFITNTPCVGFNIPGLKNIFRCNENLLADYLSITDIASKSVSILNNKEHIDFSRYASEYNISNTITQEKNLYLALTTQTHAGIATSAI